MLNISLCFNRKDFEYDVYSLIKAFYPGCEITSWYEEDGALDGKFAYYDTDPVRGRPDLLFHRK